ncbi:hypothetical protein Tco_1362102 [Tanacetum coccineum]
MLRSTQEQEHSTIISQSFEESPKTSFFRDDPLHEFLHEGSTSARSSSNQLHNRRHMAYVDAFLTVVEPKNFKQAMTEPSWIDAMQEEIHEFERLQVWELVPLMCRYVVIPSTQEQEHSPNISQGFEESPKTPIFHDDPLHESLHEDSTSQGSSSNVRQTHTPFEHLGRWTKDHPIANVIGDPSRSVSTRKQLETDAMWCYFDAFLTLVEPKNFKQAMTKPSWIDAMQEEIHEFQRLEV